jgi:2Fe-2S ferredoxin
MKLIVTDAIGQQRTITGEYGLSLMQCIKLAGVPIVAECGGCCLCSTCHVYIEADWLGVLPPKSHEENMTLDDAFEVRHDSRLACQILFSPSLSGITLRIARS